MTRIGSSSQLKVSCWIVAALAYLVHPFLKPGHVLGFLERNPPLENSEKGQEANRLSQNREHLSHKALPVHVHSIAYNAEELGDPPTTMYIDRRRIDVDVVSISECSLFFWYQPPSMAVASDLLI